MIDPNKQYKTRDGREVRIYATDGELPTPVHGAIRTRTSWNKYQWRLYAWKEDGRNIDIDGWCVGATDKGPHSWLDLIER